MSQKQQQQQSSPRSSLYCPRSPRKQVQTCTNLRDEEQQQEQQQQQSSFKVRQSFKSANNLNSSQVLFSSKNRRTSMSPSPYHTEPEGETLHHRSVKKRSYGKQDYKDNLNSFPQQQSQKQTIKLSNDRLSRYQTIMSLTQQQNKNLIQQNQYLLQKLRKMKQRQQKIKKLYMKTKNYKSKWLQIRNQTQLVKQQTFIYRSLLQDFKQIALIDIPVLKQKVQATQQAAQSKIEVNGMENKNMFKDKSEKRLSSSSQKIPITLQYPQKFESIQELAEELEQKTFGQDESPLKTIKKLQLQLNQY